VLKLRRNILTASVIAVAVVACAKEVITDPAGAPLAGLNKSVANDTSNATHTPGGTGPGFVRGTVLGQSPPNAGNDSLTTAPRIAGVVVTIYEAKADGSGGTIPGAEKGSVTTGADGLFTLPTLPAGMYVTTFVPPANSGYFGVYVTGPLYENSSQYPWWIVLQKKP
jgi:hypothetical protein